MAARNITRKLLEEVVRCCSASLTDWQCVAEPPQWIWNGGVREHAANEVCFRGEIIVVVQVPGHGSCVRRLLQDQQRSDEGESCGA